MEERLGQLYFEFRDRILRYKRGLYFDEDFIADLSERDLFILDFVDTRGQVTFQEIISHLKLAFTEGISSSTISQTLSKLYIKHKLVEKLPNPQDQRQPIIRLTEKGREVAAKNRRIFHELVDEVIRAMELSPREREIFEKAYSNGIDYFDRYFAEKS